MKTQDRLLLGNEPNLLYAWVEDVEISSKVRIARGVTESGVLLKMHRYNLDDMLVQMIEDYGEENLIKRIKSL